MLPCLLSGRCSGRPLKRAGWNPTRQTGTDTHRKWSTRPARMRKRIRTCMRLKQKPQINRFLQSSSKHPSQGEKIPLPRCLPRHHRPIRTGRPNSRFRLLLIILNRQHHRLRHPARHQYLLPRSRQHQSKRRSDRPSLVSQTENRVKQKKPRQIKSNAISVTWIYPHCRFIIPSFVYLGGYLYVLVVMSQ